ncbi:hypothetical protein SEUCBS139899_002920 [Sporothrix eucalyptigena]
MASSSSLVSSSPSPATAPPAVIPSIVRGTKIVQLIEKPLSHLIEDCAIRFDDRSAVNVPWQKVDLSYRTLAERSRMMAKVLLWAGLKHGDVVGIMGGNRYEYIETFLAAGRIGCPVVLMNNMFTPAELEHAMGRVSVSVLVIAGLIGPRNMEEHIKSVLARADGPKHVVVLGNENKNWGSDRAHTYSGFFNEANSKATDVELEAAESRVVVNDILNLQFTSGTTGRPKAACLTHRNILNDAMFVGAAMKLTPADVVSCPPPLFHCFGLVMGFLASFYHGSSIVFPSDTFNAEMTIESVLRDRISALLGVPTMFFAQLELLEKHKGRWAPFKMVRTGLAAGSQVPAPLMESIFKQMNIPSMLIAYGMTETSPVTFITAIEDNKDKRFNTIGRVLPHTDAKVVDSRGRILPIGQRGEICTAGFPLQRGYWNDEEKTCEVMQEDEHGVRWMYTGDEGYLDVDGYGYVTGRIKDLIIRGGENISPSEIEGRLLEHPLIGESCVVGLDDKKYGEAVAAFLKASDQAKGSRPSDAELRQWVSQTLGRHKAPKHVFWVGDQGVGKDLIKTASGKYQKHLMRALGNGLLKQSDPVAAKL